MQKMFEEYTEPLIQEPTSTFKAYEPCPVYGLQFKTEDEASIALLKIRDQLQTVFSFLTYEELNKINYVKTSKLVINTTRTCYFEKDLPSFTRIKLEDVV